MAVIYVLQGLPVLMLFWINNTWILYLFAVVFGVGYGGEGSPDRSFGWKLSRTMLGMATRGWISGVLFGFYDHYLLTIALSVTTSLAGASVIMSMDQTDRVLILDWEEGLPPKRRSTPVPAADYIFGRCSYNRACCW